jgi:predicted ATP-dependent Lon-type protease
MTPEQRFGLITDFFAEAFIEIRLAEIVSDSRRGHDD